ncbi:unnamed protein product, partial [Medioppia subpectinata]
MYSPVLYAVISVAVMSVMVYFVVVTYYEWPKQSIVVAVLLILLMVAYLMIGDIDARTAIGILLPAIMALIYAYLIDRELKSRTNCLQTAGFVPESNRVLELIALGVCTALLALISVTLVYFIKVIDKERPKHCILVIAILSQAYSMAFILMLDVYKVTNMVDVVVPILVLLPAIMSPIYAYLIYDIRDFKHTYIKELYVAINVLIMVVMMYFLVVTCDDWTKQVLWAPLFLLMLMVVYLIIGYYEVGTAVGILQITITATRNNLLAVKELYVAINVLIMFVMIYFLVVTCCDWAKKVLWAPLFFLMLMVVYSIIGYYEVGTAVGILQISITALIYAYLIELKLKSDRDCHQTIGCIRDGNSDGTPELRVCLPPEISETSLCAENLV